MRVAKFTFGENPRRHMEVYWSALGFERYVLDGRVLLKCWSFSFSGERTFAVDGKQLRIAHHLSWKEFHSPVYLDDQLIVEELFPDLTQQIQKARTKRWSWRSFAISVAVWMVIGFVAMYVYDYYRAQQHVSRDCPKPQNTVVASDARPCS